MAITIADIYMRGAPAIFPLMIVPPTVLMASIRLLAVIDRGDVEIEAIGEQMTLVFGETIIAELDSPVDDISVRVVFGCGVGTPPAYEVITRDPIPSTITEPIRMRIARLAERHPLA